MLTLCYSVTLEMDRNMVDGMNVQATCLNSSEEDVDCKCVQAYNGSLLPAAFLGTDINTCGNLH